MRRRDFLGALGSSAALMPFAARAVSSGGMPLIGILSFGGVEAQRPRNDAFLQRLKEMGWVDGRNVRVELRFGDGRRERADELAAEFARLKADVIVTAGVISILAAKRAMPATPIVFAITSDPVGTGVVDSLAHPGGTITGLSSQGADYGGKQVDLLREILPNLRRVGATANAGSPGALSEMRGFESAAKAAGLEFSRFEIRSAEDIAPAFETMRGRIDVLDIVPDPLTQANRQKIIALARETQIPAIYGSRDNPSEGGLMSFGPNQIDLYRRAAELVDKILRGAKPADIPVEQPTRFELVVNLKTAKELGLTIPESLIARCDEVIE
jgi:putative ABC transport system substrate-binding protein